MPTTLLPIEQLLSLLTEAPPRLATLTADLTSAQLRTSPGEGEWSAVEILAHMRACADVWGGCISTILAQVHPNIRAMNPMTWIKQTDYLELEFQPSLEAFATQRTALVEVLRQLPPESWLRGARVTGAGKALERTVWRYANGLAVHERSHVKEIARIAKTLQIR